MPLKCRHLFPEFFFTLRRDFVDKGFENPSDRLGVTTLQSVLINLYTGVQGVLVAGGLTSANNVY